MSIKRICIESQDDSIFLSGNTIHAVANNFEYVYKLSSVKKIVIHSLNPTPEYFEKSLVLHIDKDTEILIKSDHICFQPFLFQQIGTVLPLNQPMLANAIACATNDSFEIYTYPQTALCYAALTIFFITFAVIIGACSNFSDSTYAIFLISCGINIVGFILAIMAYTKSNHSKLSTVIMVIYILNYAFTIPIAYLYIQCMSCTCTSICAPYV